MNRPTISSLLQDKFNSLPENTKKIFDHPDTLSTIDKIANSYNLLSFEKDQLTVEVGYVLFGITEIDKFKDVLVKNFFITEDIAENIENECSKSIFSKLDTSKKTNQDSLNHQDILSEIENPTPSITPKEPAPQTEAKTPDEEVKKPTLEQALSGVLPTEGGFSVGDTSHPAEKVAQKLNDKLSTPTTTIPKEIYVVKKPDPYHEPIE